GRQDFKSVGPSVVFGDHVPAKLTHSEYTPEWNVDNVEPAVAVEARPFEHRMEKLAATVGIGPRRPGVAPQLFRKPIFDAGRQSGGRTEPHRFLASRLRRLVFVYRYMRNTRCKNRV